MAERLFFALWPADSVRQSIADHLSFFSIPGRATDPDNWHITLAFLGQVEMAQRRLYEHAANAIEGSAFELKLDRMGYFYRARTLWLGASVFPEPLRDLHRRLIDALNRACYQSDPRPWKAHVTLARKAPPPEALPQPEPVLWPVTSFCLMRSVTRAGGARYHKEAEYLLTA